MEEVKRRKTDECAEFADLPNAKEIIMHSTPSQEMSLCKSSKVTEPEELLVVGGEDSNPIAMEISPETPGPKIPIDGLDNGDSHSPEQNSSGFGDDEDRETENGIRRGGVDLISTDIFQTDNLSYLDRLEAYSTIFSGYMHNVHDRMHEYLTENVLFGGWKAIWKVERDRKKCLDECSILVEVDAAPATLARQLKACVHLAEPLCCIVGGELCEGKEAESREKTIRELLRDRDEHLDLVDLYPIFDESGALDDTALAIEHARFFYRHMWRSMDDEDEINCSSFMDKFLKQRLKFFYDVQDKRVPALIVKKHSQALAEYKAKCETIKGLQGQLQDGDVSDVELDMNESRIAVDIMGLHDQVETLNKTLDKLESPFLRSLMNIPTGFLSEESPEARSVRKDLSARTFLVAERLTAGMIQDLNLSPDVIIEHCRLPGDALAKSYSGDTILIFPGRYSGTGFYSLSQSITIKGVGHKEDVVLVCEELSEIFLDCEATNATISNLTLEDENSETWHGLVAVRPGSKLAVQDCVLRKGGTGVTVFRGGTLELRGCEVDQIQKHGVRCKAGSSVHVSDCLIHQCGLINSKQEDEDADGDEDDASSQLVAGIALEILESDEGEDRMTLSVTNTRVFDNHGAGVAVFLASQQDNDPEPITTVVIGLLGGVNVVDIKGNQLADNLLGEAMMAHADDF